MSPLGERARRARWVFTAAWFIGGAVAGGSAVGALLGSVGSIWASLFPAADTRLLIVGVLMLVAALADGRPFDIRYPTAHRQVNENWLQAYRRWVYASGFGLQLGFGVVTIVSTFSVYVVFAAALLSASSPAGALIGGTFGLVRGLSILPVGRTRIPGDLARVDNWFHRFDRRSYLFTVMCEAAVGITLVSTLALS